MPCVASPLCQIVPRWDCARAVALIGHHDDVIIGPGEHRRERISFLSIQIHIMHRDARDGN